MSSYEQPAVASKFSPRDNPQWIGRLFIIFPSSVEERMGENQQTKQPEPYKVVTADVAIVDLPDPEHGTPYTIIQAANIGGKGMVPQVAPYVGRGTAALGRLRQLPAQGQKSGAYVLDNYTDADVALATAFEAQNPNWRGGFSQPTPTPAAAPAYPTAPAAGIPAAAPTIPVVTAPSQQTAVPWFAVGDGPQVLAKLVAAYPQTPWSTMDENTARMAAQGLG